MSRRTRFIIFAVLIAIVAVGVVVGVQYFLSPSGDLKIGVLVSLTGTAADWGQDERNAVKMAVDEVNANGGINGTEVTLIVEDAPAEEIDPSINAFQKLVNVDKVKAVIGPTWDDVAAAIAPIADRQQIPVIAPDASSGVEAKQDYKYFFSIFIPESSEMRSLVQYIREQGISRVATIYNQDPFSKQFRDSFAAQAQEQDLEIVQDFPISDPEARDFRTIITQIKDSAAEAVYIEFTAQETKGPFMRQAQELGLDKLIVSSSTSETQSLLEEYGQFLEGLLFASPQDTPEHQVFLKKYKEHWNQEPKSPAAAYGYDAARMLIQVLRNGASTGEEIRNALLNLKGFEGATAEDIYFNQTGRVEWPPKNFTIKTVKNRAFVSMSGE